MQRLFDVLFSLLALIILSPLLFPITLLLRITGEGEILYKQKRVGLGGKIFLLYKFATMLKDSPNIGTGTVTLRNDPRILPAGHLLRKSKINELPQLFNILNGDMSIIGPRPQTQRCFDAFPEGAQQSIIHVRPGLSGIGSVVFRDEEEMMCTNVDPDHFYDREIMPYKGQLEKWYVEQQGLSVYFYLILITIWVVLFPNSKIIWRVFKQLPDPPPSLVPFLGNSVDRE